MKAESVDFVLFFSRVLGATLLGAFFNWMVLNWSLLAVFTSVLFRTFFLGFTLGLLLPGLVLSCFFFFASALATCFFFFHQFSFFFFFALSSLDIHLSFRVAAVVLIVVVVGVVDFLRVVEGLLVEVLNFLGDGLVGFSPMSNTVTETTQML